MFLLLKYLCTLLGRENGTQTENGDTFYPGVGQSIPIVELSTSESLAPMFSTRITGLTDLPASSEFAGYQIETVDFFDDIILTDIYYTGSLVSSKEMLTILTSQAQE
jgi:hypothetical protein